MMSSSFGGASQLAGVCEGESRGVQQDGREVKYSLLVHH